ncbi:hypothetical protein ACH4FX_20770 [Streptomyces sp. NPDC018019]|uniref:hypothetical protein n=1 Tax=Streptomyces sp. NPDC018019 TaxID=3365030 RepID=UPI0037B45DB5
MGDFALRIFIRPPSERHMNGAREVPVRGIPYGIGGARTTAAVSVREKSENTRDNIIDTLSNGLYMIFLSDPSG